jgi:hypothetical protein
VFFILRDQYLLTKVSITGTVVFQIRKDDRFFFGVDDSTGVMTCVLWLNDGNAGAFGAKAANRQSDFRRWFTEKEIGIGSVVTRDTSEEMLQYQQTLAAQKCYFDPYLPF